MLFIVMLLVESICRVKELLGLFIKLVGIELKSIGLLKSNSILYSSKVLAEM